MVHLSQYKGQAVFSVSRNEDGGLELHEFAVPPPARTAETRKMRNAASQKGEGPPGLPSFSRLA